MAIDTPPASYEWEKEVDGSWRPVDPAHLPEWVKSKKSVRYAAAGGILGAWCAAKTQRYVPEHLLKLMLGAITGIAGTLYVIDFFYELPFRL